ESILPHYLRSCTCFLLCAFLFFALSFHGFYSRFARVVTPYIIGQLADIVQRIAEFDVEQIPEDISWQSRIVLPKGIDGEGQDDE
ncbi:MAG: hypothetical protein LBJ11_10605, partial [Oscillospiraceae bacterium]|nr:hypothetical protein [Oscillospiraceae bacterium]